MRGVGRVLGFSGLLLLFCLAGCADPPWIMSQSPSAIYLRWYPDVTSRGEADQVAQLHCTHFGTRAVLAESEQLGSVQTATYRCE